VCVCVCVCVKLGCRTRVSCSHKSRELSNESSWRSPSAQVATPLVICCPFSALTWWVHYSRQLPGRAHTLRNHRPISPLLGINGIAPCVGFCVDGSIVFQILIYFLCEVEFVELREIRWELHRARTGEIRSTCNILVGNTIMENITLEIKACIRWWY